MADRPGPGVPPPALLVAVEGIDGAGKSGVVAHLVKHLAATGASVVATREPGGTHEGERLRALLLSGEDGRWDPCSELLLMTAARVQHVRHVVAPALAAGRLVVTDRFVGSTLAYQGAGRGLSQRFIRELHLKTVGDVWPDLTVVLDLDVAEGLARSRQRLSHDAVDEGRFEGLAAAFHERIRQAFLDQARQDPPRHAVIDAAGPPDAVRQQALDAVQRCLAGRPPAN